LKVSEERIVSIFRLEAELRSPETLVIMNIMVDIIHYVICIIGLHSAVVRVILSMYILVIFGLLVRNPYSVSSLYPSLKIP
jgi:hypothetical protein